MACIYRKFCMDKDLHSYNLSVAVAAGDYHKEARNLKVCELDQTE